MAQRPLMLGKDGSHLHNCVIQIREDSKASWLFDGTGETVTCFLNGYAIIPLEEYARLTGEDYSANIASAKEFDKIMYPEVKPEKPLVEDCVFASVE